MQGLPANGSLPLIDNCVLLRTLEFLQAFAFDPGPVLDHRLSDRRLSPHLRYEMHYCLGSLLRPA